jgi:hypothetical protein
MVVECYSIRRDSGGSIASQVYHYSLAVSIQLGAYDPDLGPVLQRSKAVLMEGG